MNSTNVLVYYYACNREVITKYCDEYHRAAALVPWEIVNKYKYERDSK